LTSIGNQTGQNINKEVEATAVSGVLNLRDVRELVNDSLNESTFAKQDLVCHGQELVLHILAQLGDELDIEGLS